jgi:hypothetical protein
MNDERFEHELKSVLREIAGREAPMSLRIRVADVIDRAPLGRRLWFAPPMKLSLAAIGAVAVLALAVLFVGPLMVGPTPSQTPEPSAGASANSVEPTASAQPTATPEPTAAPTPGVAAWNGLDWTVGTVDEGSLWFIKDVVSWGNGYVGVGASRHRDGNVETSSPAFFTSADGLHWTLAQTDVPVPDESQGGIPERLVPVDDSLLAMDHPFSGAPKLWRSEDGATWSPLDSPTWRDALASNTLVSVAAGPSGVVVVGAEGRSCCTAQQGLPMIIHSSDGVTWDRLDLSAVFDKAFFWDVTAHAGGFAIVGRVGEADVLGGPPAVGRPAAWTSADGVTWFAAEVEGAEAAGAVLSSVTAGADGLFATGRQIDSIEVSGQGWASTDGRSWQLLGKMGTDLPLATGNPANVTGDGEHMVMFGRESCKTTELSAWTSLDGVTWTQLAFSGATTSLPTSGAICNDDGTEGASPGSLGFSYAVVVRDGVFVVASSSAPVAPSYWFLTATTK